MIYTLGRTPQWASSQPNVAGANGQGQCAPPSDLQDWDNYVQAVVTHAAGQIKYWEIWNEPNNPNYYCGDVATMVTMAQHAHQIIKSIDPSAQILSPSTTDMTGPTWLASFLSQGGAETVDIIAFHGYADQIAENIVPLVANYQSVMAQNGLSSLPIWDTEASNGTNQTVTDRAAFLSKYYLLQWSQGVSRFLWYAYDGEPQWGQLADPGTGETSDAAIAYSQTENWMAGATLLNPCSKDSDGNWSCVFSRSNYQAEALWNSDSTGSVTLPAQFVQYRDLLGNIYPITNGIVPIGNEPVLAETSATAVTPLSFAPIVSQTFGNSPFEVLASSSSKTAVSYQIVSGPATISGATVTLTGAGTVTIEASQPASLGYAAANTTTSLNVAPEVPTLSFAPIPTQVFGSSPFDLSASSVSTGAVTFDVLSGPATVSGSTVTLTGAGVITLKATQAASQNYATATATTQFAVAKATTTLTFDPIADWIYGTTNTTFPVSATSSISGGVTYAVVSGPATLSYHTVTPTGLGTVVVSATFPSSAKYNAVTTTASFNVIAAPVPALTFNTIATQTFGSTLKLSVNSPSSGGISFAVVSGPATISGNVVSFTGNGTVVIRASQVANYKYASASVTTSFSVVSATPKLTFATIPAKTFGNAPFNISASSLSSGAITYDVASGPATVSGSTLTLTGAGVVTLKATQAASKNYATTTATTQFAVAKATVTLTFDPIADWVYGTTNTSFPVIATSTVSGGITYAVVSGPATMSYHTVTPNGLGTVVVMANFPSSANYNAVTTTASFQVTAAPIPALTISPIAEQVHGGTVRVFANSPSSGSISFAVASGPATISENVVSLTGSGTVVITASQAANYKYAATKATTSIKVD